VYKFELKEVRMKLRKGISKFLLFALLGVMSAIYNITVGADET
jgi:hypothetical protein